MKIRVWGLAQGWRSTAGAARGAFTWREYETESFPREDWIQIVIIEKLKGKED
jgi:hypothetical protein